MFFKYYSRAGYAIFVFMTSCFFLVGKVPAQAESDFPINTVLIKEEVLKLNPSLNILKWPKDEQIRRLEVKVRDIDLIKLIAREKIEKIIKQKYIPSDICDRFIPLRNYIKGCGALLVRYKCREFLIQLTITSANARIVIREEKSSIRETDQGKLRFVQEVMEKFFNEDDILLKTDYGPVARKGGLEGKIPKQTPTTAETEIRLRWYDTLYWWTDGEIACFWVCFSPGSSGGCVDQKNWFANVLSLEKGLRTKRGKLTQEMIDTVLGVKSGSKKYVPVIPNEIAEFEKGLYELLPGYVHGIYPKASVLAKGVSEKDLSSESAARMIRYKNKIQTWLTRVLRIELKPKQFNRADWLGIRKLHLDTNYIVGRLVSAAKGSTTYGGAVVEFQANDRSIDLTITSPLLFAADANGLSDVQIRNLASKILNIPQEKVSRIDVEKHFTTLAGIDLCYGKMRCEWNERKPDYSKREWWSYIPFWYIKGKMFVHISTIEWKKGELPASAKSTWRI